MLASSAQRPSRLVVLPCRRWATRSAIAAHGPSPGRAALAPRRRARPSSLPAGRRPESPHLRARCSGGADLERARGGRRGGACAAARVRPVHARPHVRGPVREVAWLPGRLGRLNSSRTRRLPSELKVQIGTSLVAGARRHGGAVGHRRELSDPGIRARLAGAALRASALTPIARRYTREPKSRPEMTYVLGRPTMKMKPMLCDETEAGFPGVSFAAMVKSRFCNASCATVGNGTSLCVL